jgi:aspartyl-tRNA(Asn)/glutamyl-tRNA(Gln) amidotransferase subunit A
MQAGNLCGLPALTVHCGYVNRLTIVGPPFMENAILAYGREFQNRTDFHKQHPPVAE